MLEFSDDFFKQSYSEKSVIGVANNQLAGPWYNHVGKFFVILIPIVHATSVTIPKMFLAKFSHIFRLTYKENEISISRYLLGNDYEQRCQILGIQYKMFFSN